RIERCASGRDEKMPAPGWRINPARRSSLWLTASASAGASRKVGMEYCDQSINLEGGRGERGEGAAHPSTFTLSPLHPFTILRPFINFLSDRDQRQAARRADQTFELEQRHEDVCEIGLPRRDVIAFEQPPVDEPGQSRGEAEKFHFAHDK